MEREIMIQKLLVSQDRLKSLPALYFQKGLGGK